MLPWLPPLAGELHGLLGLPEPLEPRFGRPHVRYLLELHRLVPCPHPVVFRACGGNAEEDWVGLCDWLDPAEIFEIWVDASGSLAYSLEIACHEYAHAITWDVLGETDHGHGPSWGVAYARCYSAMFERDEDDPVPS